MFKEIVDNGRRTMDIERSQKLTMSTSCSGELKISDLYGRKDCEKGEIACYKQFLLFRWN